MRSKIIWGLSALGLMCFICAALIVYNNDLCAHENGPIAIGIIEIMAGDVGENGRIVDFSTVHPGLWDSFDVIGPYTNVDELEYGIYTKWKTRQTGIEYNDSFYVLVFKKDDKVSEIALIQRSLGDYLTLKKEQYNRSESEFVLKIEEGYGNCLFDSPGTLAEQ